MTPLNGRHSTIDKPEPLTRTAPPRTTVANTSTQHNASQTNTALSAVRDSSGADGSGGAVEVMPPSA